MELIISGMTKSYKGVSALSDFSITLGKGIHFILGPNGSGKSTLMNIITRNKLPDSGECVFDTGDRKITFGDSEDYLGLLGYMPQEYGCYPNMTAYQYLEYMAYLKGMQKETIYSEINRVLASVMLDGETKKRITKFSGGMKQRLCFAQAVLGSPKILILDEPTAGMDVSQRIRVRELIKKAATECIVLMSTHICSDIERDGSDVIVMRKGTVLRRGSSSELMASMSGRVWQIECGQSTALDLSEKYKTVYMNQLNGNIYQVRIISDECPAPEAINSEPELEDYYIDVFSERDKKTVL